MQLGQVKTLPEVAKLVTFWPSKRNLADRKRRRRGSTGEGKMVYENKSNGRYGIWLALWQFFMKDNKLGTLKDKVVCASHPQQFQEHIQFLKVTARGARMADCFRTIGHQFVPSGTAIAERIPSGTSRRASMVGHSYFYRLVVGHCMADCMFPTVNARQIVGQHAHLAFGRT